MALPVGRALFAIAPLLAACAGMSPPPPQSASTPELVDVTLAPPEITAASHAPDSSAQKARADASVAELAKMLDDVDASCRDEWSDERICPNALLEAVAATYQAYYATHDDPHADEGRVDALPRLAGGDMDQHELSARLAAACKERCTMARNVAIAGAAETATHACVAAPPKTAHDACTDLGKRVAETVPRESPRWTRQCVAACDDRRAKTHDEDESESHKPHTDAASHVCFRDCMKKCTGGRIVPSLDGTYAHDGEEWMSTCDFACHGDCAIQSR